MSNLHFVYGDLLHTPADYIAHQVSCRGVMEAGLALAIRESYPKVYELYCQHCHTYPAQSLIGKAFIKDNVISIFSQIDYGRTKNITYTDYNALQTAFTNIHSRLPLDKTIAFPIKLGCDNRDTVSNLIKTCFPGRTIYVVIA